MNQNDSNKLDQHVYVNGDKYFDALCSDIQNAQQSIDLETYIFNHDSLGEKIAAELIAAAHRGIKIKVLVDGAGTPDWGDHLTKIMEQAGIQTRIFHPFPWRFWQWSRSYVRVPLILKAIYLFLKINRRNHRKTCIIDSKIAYVGSFNVSKVHLSTDQGGNNWRDTAVRITGIDLLPLKTAFLSAWNHMLVHEQIHRYFRAVALNPIIRLNNTRHLRRRLYRDLLNRIKHCKKRIWMTNAYFVPDNFLLKHLKDAAQSGIDVRIVLPHKSDVIFMPWASSAFYRSLLKEGVHIFEYLPSMLHTKTLILDDWIIVGSSNLNHRSLMHDLEVDVNIRIPVAQHIIEKQFMEDVKASQEIRENEWLKRSVFQRMIGRLLLYVKYWI